MKRMRALASLIVCVGLLGVAAAPAAAVDWSVMGIAWDTDDLSETFGAGFRAGFPVGESAVFDITAAYFEDFDNKFEDVATIGVEIGTIVADFGGTYYFGEERTGFLLGAGVTYAFMDISNLEVSGNTIFEGEVVQLRGEADDEFGFYGKIGYQATGGFFVEGLYRDLDVSVEDVEFAGESFEVPIPSDFDLDMAGFQINIGWRF
jgi:hypothetical protein